MTCVWDILRSYMWLWITLQYFFAVLVSRFGSWPLKVASIWTRSWCSRQFSLPLYFTLKLLLFYWPRCEPIRSIASATALLLLTDTYRLTASAMGLSFVRVGPYTFVVTFVLATSVRMFIGKHLGEWVMSQFQEIYSDLLIIQDALDLKM